MIFGKLFVPEESLGRRPMTLEPPSPYAADIPMFTHPSNCPEGSTFKAARWNYRNKIEVRSDPVYVARRETPQRGLEWGDYVSFSDENEHLKLSMLAFFADCLISYPTKLPTLENKNVYVYPCENINRRADTKQPSWLPTMVMTLEFKFPLPKPTDPHVSQRRVVVFTQSKFVNEPSARHDAHVEVWTAPPDGVDVTGDDWKNHQRCLAVSSQMALVVPASVNYKKGESAPQGRL